jgi:hypothetical protein
VTRPVRLATKRDHTGNRQLDRLWDAHRELVDALATHPFVNGRMLTEEDDALPGSGLEFQSGVSRSIPHGLGRRARGFVEVYPVDAPSVGHCGLRPAAHLNGLTSATHVTVVSDVTGSCWLWVFG